MSVISDGRCSKLFIAMLALFMLVTQQVAKADPTVGDVGISRQSELSEGFGTINGTTGTPLGGFGAGGVKFNANDGSFAAMIRPPADAYDFVPVRGAKFQLFT